MTPVTVLHVLNDLRPSGAERMIVAAAPTFADHSVSAVVLSFGNPESSPYAPVFAAAGIPVTFVPFSRRARFLVDVARAIRRADCAVVHVHAERGSFWVSMIAALGGRAVVRTVHANFMFSGFLRARRAAQRAVLRWWGVKFVAVGSAVARTEASVFWNPSTVIENWYDEASLCPPSEAERVQARDALGVARDDVVLVSIGNCAPVKNHPAVIRAVARVQQLSAKRVVYLHVGQEADERERELAAQVGLDPEARFLGSVDDVRPILSAADVFVMASHAEGFGIAAVEAMAMGVPCVLTDVPGLRELAAFGRATAVADRSIEGLAAALESFIVNPPGPTRLAEQAEAVRLRFGLRRGVSEHVRLYHDILGDTSMTDAVGAHRGEAAV